MHNLVNAVLGATPQPSPIAFCDFIAKTIKTALPALGIDTGLVKSHLDPVDGYLVSTKKTIEVEYRGKMYIVTVKEA